MEERSTVEQILNWLSDGGNRPNSRVLLRKKRRSKRRRPAAARHNRKCKVCRHRDRAAIERDFLRWHSPDRIAEDFGIADHSSIYRHAHATGLFDRRAKTIRLALEPIIERVATVRVTSAAIVRAIELYAILKTHESSDESCPNRQTPLVEHNATR